MKAHYKKITALAATLLLAATLAACGSSGVSSSVSPSPGYQGVVTNPPVVTYVGNNLQVSNAVTAIRQGAAPGLFVQNTALDTAASSHAGFLVNNPGLLLPGYLNVLQAGGIYGAHFENSALLGFTGASPQARATAAGYVGTVSEIMTFGALTGTACVDSLGNSVYHLIGLLSPFIDVGISFNAGIGSGSACAILLGVGSNTLGQLPTSPVFYPYDLQTAVPPNYYNSAEVPDPAADLTLAMQTPLGHPVAVSLYTLANPVLNGGDIVINAFSINDGGAALPVRVLANTGVTSNGPALTVDNLIPRAGFVVLLPLAPLAASTLHNVSFSATVKGQVVGNNWSFTTGVAN